MNGQRSIIVVLLAMSILVWGASCSEQKQIVQAERSIAVNVQTIKPSDERVVRTFSGSLEGEKQAILYAKLAEAVADVPVREGQAVKANQVIIMLDKDGPTANFNEVRSVFQNAEKNFSKMENLYKSGAISESQFDAAKTQFEVAKANYESVSRLVDVRTPISGTVTSIAVRDGDFVHVGQQLAVVATPGKLRVKFAVNTDNVQYITQGAEVRIVSEVVNDTVTGRVVSIAESADPVTRSFQVEAMLDNDGSQFRPGMFVKILVTERELPQVLAVPRAAVLQLENANVAFVIENGIAKKRMVTLGPELEGRVVILDGLKPGDTLVTLGQNYLDEGFKVTISSAIEG